VDWKAIASDWQQIQTSGTDDDIDDLLETPREDDDDIPF